MKAVRVEPDGSVCLVEMPIPAIAAGEALMRTRAAGICGSDLLDWYVRRKAGTVLGHEVAGEIVAVGEGVSTFAPGDRIVPHHHAPCLECGTCRAGRFVHCAAWRSSALDPGGMAELVRIPAGNLARDTQKIPRSLSDEEASATEPLATVVKAFRRGRFEKGQSVFIVGLGPMGQLAVRLSRALGATRIAGADRVASRILKARESGAETFDVDRESLAEGARRFSDGKGFDFVFVGPGKSDVIASAAATVAPGGVLLVFTMPPPEEELRLQAHDFYFREVTLVPSYSCGPDDTRIALELLVTRRVEVADLVTHRFPIERAGEAFTRARQPEGSLKVMITFS
ncbi:MAG TPA: alcohol dehydrogenase catalytic domain-containing protein [Thermoanaerobaculia bacterium]|nr:alcohol dehydrogenase catalytic domain-containing protein [Thermoanaerobaculia bacterium]